MNRGSGKRRQFLDRLTAIEKRLARLSGPPPDLSRLEARLSGNRAELRAIKERLTMIDSGIVDLSSRAASVVPELEERIRSYMAGLAPARGDAGNMQERVNARVSSIESEVAQQRAALVELQQCSLQTERTMQKLLRGIDRLISGNDAQAHSR